MYSHTAEVYSTAKMLSELALDRLEDSRFEPDVVSQVDGETENSGRRWFLNGVYRVLSASQRTLVKIEDSGAT